MEQDVVYGGGKVGRVCLTRQAQGVCWDASCAAPADAGVLRLYGMCPGRPPLRIGVLEPQAGVLRLTRTLSWDTLRRAGYDAGCLPEQYVLADGAQPPACTGDGRLDALIASGAAQCRPQAGGWQVCVPFRAGEECPLAFALTACALCRGQAVLHVPRAEGKNRNDPVSSDRMQ